MKSFRFLLAAFLLLGITANSNASKQVDLSNESQGIYFVNINMDGNIITERIAVH